MNTLCASNDASLKQDILHEAHNSTYVMHLVSNKMYNDLKLFYWWPDMKNEITKHVTKCLVCQQVKT